MQQMSDSVNDLKNAMNDSNVDQEKDDELNETFYQLMKQLMALQTYLQEDEGLENKATWDYRREKAAHYAPALWPVLLLMLFVILFAVGICVFALVITNPDRLWDGSNDNQFLFIMAILCGIIGYPGTVATPFVWFDPVLRRLSSSDTITYDDSKNQLPVSLLDVIQQAGLQSILDLLNIFMDDNLITQSDIQALGAKTLGGLRDAIDAIRAKEGFISKPGFTYSESVCNKFTLFSQQKQSKLADTVVELGAGPDSRASESKNEQDAVLPTGESHQTTLAFTK